MPGDDPHAIAPTTEAGRVGDRVSSGGKDVDRIPLPRGRSSIRGPESMDGPIDPPKSEPSVSGRTSERKPSGLTAEGRRRLREAALANRPWDRSTGPRTAEGKARSASNGSAARPNPRADTDLTTYRGIIAMLARVRALAILHRGLRPTTEPIGPPEPFDSPFR